MIRNVDTSPLRRDVERLRRWDGVFGSSMPVTMTGRQKLNRIVTCISLLCFVTAVATHGQDVNGDGFVTVLVPVNVPSAVPGLDGTLWKTELWVHNSYSVPLRLVGCGDVLLPLPCTVPFHDPGVNGARV